MESSQRFFLTILADVRQAREQIRTIGDQRLQRVILNGYFFDRAKMRIKLPDIFFGLLPSSPVSPLVKEGAIYLEKRLARKRLPL